METDELSDKRKRRLPATLGPRTPEGAEGRRGGKGGVLPFQQAEESSGASTRPALGGRDLQLQSWRNRTLVSWQLSSLFQADVGVP
jgi:hypothetical protein